MSLVRVLRTRDRRWRVEQHDDGMWWLWAGGFLVLRRRPLQDLVERLAAEGVRPEDLEPD